MSGHVIIHVGLPKTGTTSLQQILRRNRALLAQHGIQFPRFENSNGQAMGHSAAAWSLCSGNKNEREQGKSHFQRALSCAQEDDILLFSSEDISKYAQVDSGRSSADGFRDLQPMFHNGDDVYWDRRVEYLRVLRNVFHDKTCEVWITLRRRDDFCSSIYRQAVLNRNYVGTPSELSQSNFALFDYERILGQYNAIFDKIRVFLFEDYKNRVGGIVGGILDELGIRKYLSEQEISKKVNTAFHPDVLEFIRRTNYLPLQKQTMLRRLYSWASTDQKVQSDGKYNLLSHDECLRINERFAESDVRIRNLYQVETPGRSTLFPDIDLDERRSRQVYEGMSQRRFEEICYNLNLVDVLV